MTFFPLLPDVRVPFFFLRIADSTRLPAAFPYFLPPDDFRAAIVRRLLIGFDESPFCKTHSRRFAEEQVGAIFAHNARGRTGDKKVFVLTGLDHVKFKRPVEPGDQLRMELTCLKRRGSFWKMRGVATVDDKLVAQAEISAMEVELA